MHAFQLVYSLSLVTIGYQSHSKCSSTEPISTLHQNPHENTLDSHNFWRKKELHKKVHACMKKKFYTAQQNQDWKRTAIAYLYKL